MPLFDTQTRDQLRQTYADAWRKHLAHSPLTALESMIADVIGAHPEYQAIMSDANSALAFEPDVLGGNENPFLHMGLHLAVRDQVSIDRPPGVRELHELSAGSAWRLAPRRACAHGGPRRNAVAGAAQRPAAR